MYNSYGYSLLDPVRIIVPEGDVYYGPALISRARSYQSNDADQMWQYSRFDGLWLSLGFCALFLLLRRGWNWGFSALFRQQGSKGKAAMLDKVEEEAYTTVGGAVLLWCGWEALKMLDQCSMFSSLGCVRGWPLIPMAPYVHRYYNAELGWYLHLMLKHSLGLGLQDTRSMDLHHFSTVGLIVLSYFLNLHTLGLMIFSLLNISSPILHASKLANTLDMRRTKVALFALFAAVFAVTRVGMFPYVVVQAAGVSAYREIPRLAIIPFFFWVWATFLGLLALLAAMQGWWFLAIVKILTQAASGDDKGVRAEVLKRDFSRDAKDIAAKM